MKYVKMLGLAAIAAAALMAFVGVGSASATELTCGASMCAEHTLIKSESEGSVTLDAPFGNVVCKKSTVEGTTSNTGSATTTVSGAISSLTFTECGSNTVTVLESGSLEIHTPYTKEEDGHETQSAASNNNGTLTSSGAKVTVIHLGVHCIAETNATDIGTLTGAANTAGGEATLDISARIPITEGTGGAFCGTSAPWTGSYKITAPNPTTEPLNVD